MRRRSEAAEEPEAAVPAEEHQVLRRAAREGDVGVLGADEHAHDAAELDGVGAHEQGRGLLQDHGEDRWCVACMFHSAVCSFELLLFYSV